MYLPKNWLYVINRNRRRKATYRIYPDRSTTARECKGLTARLKISIIKPVVRYLQQWYICIFMITGTV